MTDASGTTTYSYDSLDRLTMKATPEGTLSYTYDAAGNIASMSSSDGNVSVSYTWDELKRLSRVVDHRLSGSNTTAYTYDSARNLATASYPNGIQTTFSYDTLNRLTGQTSRLGNYSYQLGPTGNRTSASEQNGRSVTWNYDGIYRLTSETISGDPSNINGSVAYGLDPVGNRLSASSTISGVASGSFSFNGDDLIGGDSYDANGNTTATGGKTFAYDSENRLKSLNGGAVTLLSDGDGNRVAKTVNGVTTRYLVDDLNPTGYAQVVEESVGGAVQRAYAYGLQRIDVIQLVNSTWMLSFYGYDGFGSVRQLTNATGAVTDTYEYDAFGNKTNSTGSTPNNYLYRAEQYDTDLGLYYLRARYYNPLTGRFMSRDPDAFCDCSIRHPAALHKYLYGEDDPIDLADPLGRNAMPVPLPPPPGPVPVPNPEPAPDNARSGASVEYALIVGEISLGSIAGIKSVAQEVNCMLYTAADALGAIGQNLGFLQNVQLNWSGCTARSSKMPGEPLGPYKAPFTPSLPWATSPGNPWGDCEANSEEWILSCRKRCPDGGEEWFTWDPGTKYGEPPHWDYHRCDNTTCKIYLDGTSTCSPAPE